MIQVKEELDIHKGTYTLFFIHSPFCGTCHVARKMLDTIEELWGKEVFYDVNAPLFPDMMQTYKVESVPCLLVLSENEVCEKIYAFHSVPHMLEIVKKYS